MSIFSFFRKKPQFQYNPNEVVEEVVESTQYSSSKSNDLEFVDLTNTIFATVPIQLAKDVPISSRELIEKKGNKFTFPLCPGMWDFARMGYILPAWTDFHIKANKAGVAIVLGGGGKTTPFLSPFQMDTSISDEFVEYNGVSDNVYNFASPWRVFSNTKNISCLLLPAWYHARKEILDNMYFYPGVVDYDRFRALNVIVSVMNKCTLHIKAGEPLLHIIPFFNERIVCGYGPPTPAQAAESNYDPVTHTSHFYRKKHQVKKDYKLEEIESQEENKE
mgnify:CR=1 FL=1